MRARLLSARAQALNVSWLLGKRANFVRSFPLVLVLLLTIGCGEKPPVVPEGTIVQRITGQVTQSDGTPLGQGKVVLTPDPPSGEPLSGWLDSDGTFTLMEGKGMTISHGDFRVHIEPPSIPKELVAKTAKAQALIARLQKSQQQIPAKYQKAESSKIKVTIRADTKSLPTIVLK